MSINEPIRIISDLHLGLSASAVQNAEQIAPLFQNVGSVIFNGDTVEMRFTDPSNKARRNSEALAEACRKAGAEPCFINGNHDPTISALNHADLADGGVLVTHGDMLFHNISPWCREMARVMGEAHTRALAELEDEAFHDFEKRLDAGKRAAQAIELKDFHLSQGTIAQFAFVLGQCWPPTRPLQILKCWHETPGKAIALTRVFRPRARLIIIGHTHRAHIWRIGPRVVINTGSFLTFAKRFAVDVTDRSVSVKKIKRAGDQLVIGKEIARFDASKLKAHEGY